MKRNLHTTEMRAALAGDADPRSAPRCIELHFGPVAIPRDSVRRDPLPDAVNLSRDVVPGDVSFPRYRKRNLLNFHIIFTT